MMTLKDNIQLLLIASIIPFVGGLNSGASGLYSSYLTSLNLSNFQIILFEVIFVFSFGFGAFFGGITVDKWNLKKIQKLVIIITVLSCFLIQFFNSYNFIAIHRLILGFSLGFLSMTVQIKLIEILVKRHRGKLFVLYMCANIIGSITIFQVAYWIFKYIKPEFIRYELLQVPCIILPLFFLLINTQIANSKIQAENIKITSLFKHDLKPVLLTISGLVILYGLASPMYYLHSAEELLEPRSLPFPILISLVATLISAIMIDFVGRKKLLLFGCICMIFILLLNSIVFQFVKTPAVILILTYVYIFFYAFSVTSLFELLILEIIPHSIKGRVMIIVGIFTWFAGFINNTLLLKIYFLSGEDLSIASTLMLIFAIVGFVVLRKNVFETNGLSLNEIEKLVVKDV